MQDGSRRVTSITEVGRMESDVITLSELFKFKVDEVLPDRTVVGRLESTGLRPTFLDKFERRGIALPTSLFGNGRATVPEIRRSAERDDGPRLLVALLASRAALRPRRRTRGGRRG